jgi:hypothetical protein
MTLRQTRIAFRFLFLLPAAALGLALFATGLLRSIAQFGGAAIPEDTMSGPAALALSLLPLTAVALIAWVLIRRPQKLPPPSAASIAPALGTGEEEPARGPASARRFDLGHIRPHVDALGLELESERARPSIALVKEHRWAPGYLLAALVIVLAAWLLPPSLAAGSLAPAPINGGLLGVGIWIALVPLLLALPLSDRRVELNPDRDEIRILEGRRVRVLGLSRLLSLEVRTMSESMRDSEIQAPSSTRRHALLIAWIEADGRGPTPFTLIGGPRQQCLDRARSDEARMTEIAAGLARGLGCSTGQPDGANGDEAPYD